MKIDSRRALVQHKKETKRIGFFFDCPQRESNSHNQLRSLAFYPLNYEGASDAATVLSYDEFDEKSTILRYSEYQVCFVIASEPAGERGNLDR